MRDGDPGGVGMKRLFLCVVLLSAVFGCSRKQEKRAEKDAYVYEPVRMAAAYVSLVEKPDAARALFVGEEAKSLTNVFSNAGIACFTSLEGKFDLIVVACEGMSKTSCGKLCASLADDGVITWIMDVREATAEEMLERFRGFDLPSVHLWMSGETRWLLVGRKADRKVRLSAMMDVFVRERAFADLEKAHCGSLPEVFAGYVGTMNDVAPAFYNLKRDETMSPGLFVTKEIPEIGWIDAADVDEDIRKGVLADIRSMQVVRRLAIQGGLAAVEVKGKKDEEAVADIFARVTARNPNDLFVLERLDRLERNAKAFLEAGKLLMAMKCYETMVLIRPNDPVAMNNFGMCLKKIGKVELAKKILERAEMLARRGEREEGCGMRDE